MKGSAGLSVLTKFNHIASSGREREVGFCPSGQSRRRAGSHAAERKPAARAEDFRLLSHEEAN